MKPTTNLAKHVDLLLMVSLLLSAGCAMFSKPQPAIVGQQCSIIWDKTDDPKVTGYHLIMIDQSRETIKTEMFIPADTTIVSCKDAGADHAGLWGVVLRSCYDKSTCGAPTETAYIQITAE